MGVFDALKRKDQYNKLRIITKDRILMQFTIQQIQKLYGDYVSPSNASGKTAPEDITPGTIIMDIITQKKQDRKFFTTEIKNNLTLEQIANYADKHGINTKEIMKEYEEQKALI